MAFDALGLDALFRTEDIGPGGTEPLRTFLGSPSVQADPAVPATIVCWFGSRDPGFVRRLTARVPGAVVAPSSAAGRPVWQHLVATIGGSPEEAERWREPVPVPADLVDEGRRALGEAGWDGRSRLLVVHPGAGGVGKRWPAEGFAAILAPLGARAGIALALHQGPADAGAVAAVVARLGRPAIVLEEPALPTLAGALGSAAAYLGNDSGVSHLAAALGVPSVVLFGADKLDWRPWARHVEPLAVRMAALDTADRVRVAAVLTGLLG